MTVSLEGLHPQLMRPRVESLLADPEAAALGIYVVSAFRSIAHQRRLFEAAVQKYGGEAAARRWVASPGTSNHGPKIDGYGTAVDLGVAGVKTLQGQWPDAVEHKVNVIARRHGLQSPMDWEDWHFEPIPNWVAPAPASPTLPTHLLEELMPLFKNDDDALVFGVVYAYSVLLGRPVESLEILLMQCQSIRDNGYAHVWDEISKSGEALAHARALVG